MSNFHKLHLRKSTSIPEEQFHVQKTTWTHPQLKGRILLPNHEVIETYNTNGKILTSEFLSYAGKELSKSTSKYTYDNQNRLIETLLIKEGILKRKGVITFPEPNIKQQIFLNNEGVQIGQRILEVAIQKENLMEKTKTFYNLDGNKSNEVVYVYDEHGNEIMMRQIGPNYDLINNSIYNTNNQIIEKRLNSKGVDANLERFIYNEKNQLIEKESTDLKLNTTLGNKYFYNEKNDLIKQETYHDNKLTQVSERIYQYDNFDNYVLMIQNNKDYLHISSSPNQEVEQREIEYYE